MTPDEKRQYIDMAYLQMIKIAQVGNELFKNTKDAFERKKANQ
jgi:hypothetical protein